MKIERLDHVNVRTSQLEKMIEWYERVLGLNAGWRPNFGFPGAWLYADGTAVVHLVGVEADAGAGSEQDLKLEHFALTASGRDDFEGHLNATETRFERANVDDANVVQFNIWDPDGNHIHIDFSLDE